MAAEAPPTVQPAEDKQLVSKEDLALTTLVAVATTFALARFGLEASLVGVALAPLIANRIQKFVGHWRNRTKIGGILALLLFDRGERAFAGSRSLVATATVSTVLTVGLFTAPELALGNSLASDRRTTFFHANEVGTVADLEPPALTVSDDLIVVASGRTRVPYTVSAFDRVDGRLTPTCSPPSGSRFPIGTTIVRCSAADTHGNRARDSFTVTVRKQRGRAPAVIVPDAPTREATGPAGARVTYRVTARDDDGNALPVRCEPVSGAIFGLGTTRVTCTTKDREQRLATRRFPVVVQDTAPPKFRTPNDIGVETGDRSGRTVFYEVSATDRVGGRLTARCSPPPGSRFAVGLTTVQCSAADASGNRATAHFTVSVGFRSDRSPPELRLPDDARLEATSEANWLEYSASATDEVDGNLRPTCSPPSGASIGLGKTTVRCSVADSAGNRTRGSFSVTVVDTKAPALTLPSDIEAEATSPAGASVRFRVSADDLADRSVAPVCSHGSGSSFRFGRTTVRCSVTDAAGNRTGGSFDVTVVDTNPPTLKLPADLRAEASSASGARVDFEASAGDSADGSLAPRCAPASGSTFAIGATTVRCSATDAHGNRADGSFAVTVADTKGPSLKFPGDITTEASSPEGARVSYEISALDAVDGAVAPACSRQPGIFRLGTHPITCVAADRRGNRTEGTFTIRVVDSTPPVLRLPKDFSVVARYLPEKRTYVALLQYPASAYDRVDRAVAPTCSPPSGTSLNVESSTSVPVTCSALDRSGNRASGSFTVKVDVPSVD